MTTVERAERVFAGAALSESCGGCKDETNFRCVRKKGGLMPTIETCGPEGKRKTFTYRGSARDGVVIEFDSGDFEINAEIIQSVLEHFGGRRVRGGFSMTTPTPGGVGEYLGSLGKTLTPRHAAFLCAVLQHQGLVKCELEGNAVLVDFNA